MRQKYTQGTFGLSKAAPFEEASHCQYGMNLSYPERDPALDYEHRNAEAERRLQAKAVADLKEAYPFRRIPEYGEDMAYLKRRAHREERRNAKRLLREYL